MSFAILTDVTANLELACVRANEIVVLPFSYFVDGQEHICMNTEDFDCHEYYDKIRKGTEVNTVQINPQTYMEFMRPLLQAGQDILFVGLSSGVSGSFASANIARQELLEEYPQREIELIDSYGASLGIGLLAFRGAKCRENGMSLKETAQRLLKLRSRMYQIFTVDDLMHLRRTGRLSNMGALVGHMLGIKPLLKGNDEGKIVVAGKVRGRKQAIRAMAEKYISLVQNPSQQTVGISHADCEEDALYLMELLQKNLPPKEFMLVKHEPVTGSHIGPGALALYFEGDDNVRLK